MMREKLATLSVFLVFIIVPGFIVWHRYNDASVEKREPGTKVFEITGFAENGVWTLNEVNGLNYWWKQFEPMTIHVNVGDQVVLKLQSADIFHQFYVPALDIGPIDVKAGHPVKVELKAVKAGVYQYFCTSLCGGCHFYMTGWIIITPAGEIPAEPPPIVCPICLPDFSKRPEGDMVTIGEYLFLKMSCVTCHGTEGRGGVKNYNYAKDTVPAHNTTAEKIFLKEREDAEAFIDLVIENEDLDNLAEQPDIPLINVVLDRYKAARELAKKGSTAVKLDKEGPMPPLQMPAWKAQLTEREIDALLVYFVSLYPWEEDEDDSEWEDENEPGWEEDGDNL